MKTRTKVILIVGLILVVLALLIINGMFYIVNEDEHACVVRFSEIVDVKSEPGIYMKMPFIDTVNSFPKKAQFYDINPSTVILDDKMNMIIDSYILWKIEDPKAFYRSFRNLDTAQTSLDSITYEKIKNTFGTLQRSDVVNMDPPDERNDIYQNICDLVREEAQNRGYGITVLDVKVKKIDLPESNESEVFNQMISERNQMAELYRAEGVYNASLITNEADKNYNTKISEANLEAEVITAEGEKEYMKIISGAYSTEEKLEFYRFVRSLQALESSLKGSGNTIILSADSELVKILMSP